MDRLLVVWDGHRDVWREAAFLFSIDVGAVMLSHPREGITIRYLLSAYCAVPRLTDWIGSDQAFASPRCRAGGNAYALCFERRNHYPSSTSDLTNELSFPPFVHRIIAAVTEINSM
jgi:hypothetical protein